MTMDKINIAIFVVASIFSVFNAGGQATPLEGVLHIKTICEQADLVLIGSLEQIQARYVETHKDFYQLKPEIILTGMLETNSLLVVHQDIDFSEGSHPAIEAHVPYMMFLECISLDEQLAPHDTTYFQVSQTWKGMIPLDIGAKEQRPFYFLDKDYNINLAENAQEFREALLFYFDLQNGTVGNGSTLSEGALKVYEKLGFESNCATFFAK